MYAYWYKLMHECELFTGHLRFVILGDLWNMNFAPEQSCVGLQSEMRVSEKVTASSIGRSVRAAVSGLSTLSIL